jgi:predicted nucleic acid-binding protein
LTIVDTTVWIDYFAGTVNPHTDWLDRSRGHTVRKTIACLIATFCLTEGHSLLHRDPDFDPFERYLSLQVVHP